MSDVLKMYNDVLETRKVVLSDLQRQKFLYACEKAIAENPTLNFSGQKQAASIYLNYILDFPELDLGPIITP